ncbi:MAG TPA: DUF4350 domain-containing protein [Myxococcaceae bacterium]|nr:DUF4350 domain-containing protein [Myxococcaceae bacterium]
MSGPARFSRRWLVVLGVVGCLSLSAAAVLALDAPTPPAAAPPPGVASRAANGHAAFLAFVRGLGITARVGPTAGHGEGVVWVLEPDLDPERPTTLARLGARALDADTVVVVLPKWTGEGDLGRPGWLARAQLLPIRGMAAGLTALHLRGSVVRREGTLRVESRIGSGTAELETAQLVTSEDLVPLVSGPDGILVGEREEDDQQLVVVADPDLLSNAGLGRGDNARVLAQLLSHLDAGEDGLTVDETLQARQARSILAGLLHFPSLLAVLQLLVVLGLAVWAGTPRFGTPLREPDEGAHGSAALIESAVILQTLAGSAVVAVRALLESARREVLERMHAPAGLDSSRADAWLDARRRGSGVPTSAALRAEVQAATTSRAALAAGRRIQRWRERMLDGAR